jgi:hypothetical protein
LIGQRERQSSWAVEQITTTILNPEPDGLFFIDSTLNWPEFEGCAEGSLSWEVRVTLPTFILILLLLLYPTSIVSMKYRKAVSESTKTN